MKKESQKPSEKIISLWIQPKSSCNEVVGFQGEFLRIRVKAPPAGGQANRQCCRILAETLGIAPSRVEIISGHSSRRKRARIQDGGTAAWDCLPWSKKCAEPDR